MTRDGWALTREDVRTTGAALAAALKAFAARQSDLGMLLKRTPTEVTLTGCGSALSAASVVAPFLQSWAHVPARAVAASDLVFNPERLGPTSTDPLLVAFSRTGRTTETVLAATAFAARFPGRVIVLTCSSNEPLSTPATVAVEAVDATDRALPQTRSYAAMLLLGLKLAAAIGRADAESDAVERAAYVVDSSLAMHADAALACGSAAATSVITFLGSGPFGGLAREGAIKTIEMSLTTADAMPFLEIRHGPNALVGKEMSIVGLVSPGPAAAELRVMRDLASQGAETLALVPADVTVDCLPSVFRAPAGLRESLLPFAYLPVLQLLALGRARAAGADPNKPPHVRHYVEVEDLADAQQRR